ncbi:hypothetical protein ATANTOWER_014254 [Ataeniobius toweri]|uniref:Uncharacterized protein n=1 Tax=Ataeniobius toweri TaxID=208326 RepID=A0ABU7AQH9_9TELE|nr:hypothetical protein [Ataeniobius toweri]
MLMAVGIRISCSGLSYSTLLLYNSLIKRMLRVLHNVLNFMKNPSLHNNLQMFQRSLQNRASFLKLFQVHGSDATTPADDDKSLFCTGSLRGTEGKGMVRVQSPVVLLCC